MKSNISFIFNVLIKCECFPLVLNYLFMENRFLPCVCLDFPRNIEGITLGFAWNSEAGHSVGVRTQQDSC